jgi:hypothetical protein
MNQLKPRFASNLWCVLKTMPVPTFIFEEGKLVLKECELSLYLYLCLLANKQHSNCEVSVTIAELVERTRYGHAQVERGLKGLREKKFIGQREMNIRHKTGQFSGSEYVMTHPKKRGKALSQQKSDDRRNDTALGSALFYEKQAYFQAPEHLGEMLGRLRGTALVAYVAALQLASLRREREFETTVQEWRKLANIARNETLEMAAEKLEEEGVLGSISSERRRYIKIYLKNPINGRDLEDEVHSQEYGREAREERDRRESERPYTRDRLLLWASSVFKVPVSPINDGEIATYCKCGGYKNRKFKPTLRMNGDKGRWGVYYCDHCQVGGTLLELVMKQGRMGLLEAIGRLEGRTDS